MYTTQQELPIRGVEMEGKGTAFLVENASHTAIFKNTITNFQLGVAVEKGDETIIWENAIINNPGGLTGD